jgi:hypothetical protein
MLHLSAPSVLGMHVGYSRPAVDSRWAGREHCWQGVLLAGSTAGRECAVSQGRCLDDLTRGISGILQGHMMPVAGLDLMQVMLFSIRLRPGSITSYTQTSLAVSCSMHCLCYAVPCQLSGSG